MPPQVRLLGAAEVHADGAWQPLPRDKRGALLVYLAYGGDWVERERLAFLFWPDKRDAEARRNLRQLLNRIRALAPASALEADAGRLRWRTDCDAVRFRAAVADRRWNDAVALYRGALCLGLSVPDAAGFDSWLEQTRDALGAQWQEAGLAAAQDLVRSDRHTEAAALLARILASDPLDEQVLHAYLRAAHAGGRRDEALSAFAAFRKRLEGELGLAPLAETLAVVRAVRDDRLPVEPAASVHALPQPTTPFVGRGRELGELDDLLADPGCRLLTLIGVGGVGKSRLSLELAERHQARFEHGARFVPLGATAGPQELVSALAAALDFSFYGRDDPEEQLLAYLRDRELLLVLDTFEHLTAAGGLLAEIAAAAPGVTQVVTSREALALREAWRYDVAGLAHGDGAGTSDLDSDAARVFLHAAQRSDPRYRLAREDGAAILEICRLSEGMPLALELAAGWIRDLSPAEIAHEIQVNLDFLSSPDADGLQSSMRAVFEQSWGLLSPEQQVTLARLACFRGGFGRRAAQQVAGASLYLLLSLVGKSLLQKNRHGRYDTHEIVRQFAFEKLADAGEEQAVLARHAHHYTELLELHQEDLRGRDQLRSLAAVAGELDNVRAARRWIVERGDLPLLAGGIDALATFFELRSFYREGRAAFERTAAALTGHQDSPEGSLGLARARLHHGHFAHLLGDNDVAAAELQRALAGFRSGGEARGSGDALHRLAQLRIGAGAYDEAERLALEGLELAQTGASGRRRAPHLTSLAQIAIYRGDYPAAEHHYREALGLQRSSGDQNGVARCLDGLTTVAHYRGRFEEARAFNREVHAIAEALGNPNDVARSWYNVAGEAYHGGDYLEAETAFRNALDIYRDIGNRRAAAGALQGVAAAAFGLKDISGGTQALSEALALFEAIGHRQGVAEMTHKLALFTKLSGNLLESKRLYLDSLALAREIGALRDEIICLDGLGHVASDEGDYAEAWARSSEALERAAAIPSQGLVFHCLLNFLRLLSSAGDRDRVRSLAALIVGHPAANVGIRSKAEEMAAQDGISATALAATEVDASDAGLDLQVQSLLTAGLPVTLARSA